MNNAPHSRFNVFNEELVFNNSPIKTAPLVSISLPVLNMKKKLKKWQSFLFFFCPTKTSFLTLEIQGSQCGIIIQWFTYYRCSIRSDFVHCSYCFIKFLSKTLLHKRSILFRFRSFKAELTFSNSPNTLTPFSETTSSVSNIQSVAVMMITLWFATH